MTQDFSAKRPTIKDLSQAAGVSVTTVNRVINSPNLVRRQTRELVLKAAEKIGFYGVGSIQDSLRRKEQVFKLGVLLQQKNRTFYRDLAKALSKAAGEFAGGRVELKIQFMDDLSPDNVATQLVQLGRHVDAVGLVAAEHPIVSDAIDTLHQSGVPVFGLIASLTANASVGYVGLDHFKVGRTAAWAFDKMCRGPGKIGILVGNHRYRNQESNESGFRSYFREHNTEFTLLEAQTTYETAAVAEEIVEKMFQDHADLCGLFISGGGIRGAINALRARKLPKGFVSVGYELIDETRSALIDGTLSMVISHPMETFARATITAMTDAVLSDPNSSLKIANLGFDIYTPENI
ncbi:transcriptional regulator, LacI family [Thalassococcus halodurans]|uniref:Transcriptional regulator, LacI family n=1 Tax=Thalassococcus halodurans TaxID=373675 RepID=A0A1H5X7S2_9RHOB|nr:LacI family DNA-binding transcriptional regulator [Thalassococcus halodurans]SEG07772.1 transcriptional regulator, LacI family [Thalassococcus halodurans]